MTLKSKSIQEQTAADTKSIGFDYQYYYFLYKLLELRTGQAIGYEVKDDVHLEKENGELILIQLKHSLENKSNLTEKDIDLWKTLANWTKIINDSTQDRSTELAQLSFIKNTTFILTTNKSNTNSNKFIQLIFELKNNENYISEIRKHLTNISTPKEGKYASEVDNYIKLVLNQSDLWLLNFLTRVDFLLNKDSLIQSIKTRIREKNVMDSRVDDVYEAIDSNLRTFMYETVKNKQKIIIDFDLYYKKFTKFFELGGRDRKLLIRSFDSNLPKSPINYLSIKQLLDAEIIDEKDPDFQDELIRIFSDKLTMHNNEQKWLQDSDITDIELENFNSTAIRLWKQNFDLNHASLKKELRKIPLEQIPRDNINNLALQNYHETLKLQLILDETELDIQLSNGKFYLLSEKPLIGWVYDWKERFSK